MAAEMQRQDLKKKKMEELVVGMWPLTMLETMEKNSTTKEKKKMCGVLRVMKQWQKRKKEI